MNELSWFWIALALIVPPVVGGLVALPLWLRGEPIFGNLVGTAVIFGAAIALILRERVELHRHLRERHVQLRTGRELQLRLQCGSVSRPVRRR